MLKIETQVTCTHDQQGKLVARPLNTLVTVANSIVAVKLIKRRPKWNNIKVRLLDEENNAIDVWIAMDVIDNLGAML